MIGDQARISHKDLPIFRCYFDVLIVFDVKSNLYTRHCPFPISVFL